jgi:von Willebrand factor A domain-containing protein 8
VEELTARGLKRVSPRFRVIALGLPVPEYPGFPIDPPLRSRFQGRYVSAAPLNFHLESVTKQIEAAEAEAAAVDGAPSSALMTTSNLFTFLKALSVLQHSSGGSVDSGGGLLDSPKVLPIPEMTAENIKNFLALFPEETNSSVIIKRLYPFHLFNLDNAQHHALESMLESFNTTVKTATSTSESDTSLMADESMHYRFLDAQSSKTTEGSSSAKVIFETKGSHGGAPVAVWAAGGSHLHSSATKSGIKLVGSQVDVLTSMMQSHCLGHDICLVGKTLAVQHHS